MFFIGHRTLAHEVRGRSTSADTNDAGLVRKSQFVPPRPIWMVDDSDSIESGGDPSPPKLKIYFLPNLMTAGNLFCGFLALTKIVEADFNATNFNATIKNALFFILLACIFDLLDGRLARMGGSESP